MTATEQGRHHMPNTTAQSVADALAGVDHVQNTPDEWGMGPAHELAALRDLADAVRDAQRARYDEHAHCVGCGAWMKAGHGPGCWVGAAEAVRAQPVTPVPGVTMHDGYVVRHVITTAGRDAAWFVAAQGGPGFDQRWSTWRVEAFGAGSLDWSIVSYHDGPAGPDGLYQRASALRDLAERAGIAL
jgi:hypothetical protein